MFNVYSLVIEHFVAELEKAYRQTYGQIQPEVGEIIAWIGRLALENIANSDALYHNVEHTIMIALVGQAILKGKHLREGNVTPEDWLHYMIAVLCHDIGYVKGICRADDRRTNTFATGVGDQVVTLPSDGTDIALTPYHVDRGKLFVRERFGNRRIVGTDIRVDVDRVAAYIEITRFPAPDDPFYQDTSGYAGLVRAADFIGQLGDPNYLRKIPALFYEFEENDTNVETGYHSPGDMRRRFAGFYWDVVRHYIQPALEYLRLTQEGKLWIANLYSHIFEIEHPET